MPKPLKLYPVNGEMLTIKQAAERAFVSVNTLRNQLTNHGGSMQAVMDYYDSKNSGGNEVKKIIDAKPEKAAEPYEPQLGEGWKKHCEKSAEAEAAEKIAGILGLPADAPEMETVHLTDNAGVMRVVKEAAPEPAMQIEELTPAQMLNRNRGRLQMYNAAIAALAALQEDEEANNDGIFVKAVELEQAVRALRIRVFEPMIDWAALAGK